MSNKLKLSEISTSEAQRVGVSSLADRPTGAARYGDGGLTAQGLKERFDALPNFVREKFNAIAQMLADTDAAKYITIGAEDNRLGETLFDFLSLFGARGEGQSGKNISDYIETLYDIPLEDTEGNKNYSRTLKDIMQSIVSRFADVETNKGAKLELEVAEDGKITVKLLNAAGEALGGAQTAGGPVKTAGIADGAVTTDKIANGNVTTEKLDEDSVTESKIANGNVTTEKLEDAAVTGAKLAAGSVSDEKLAVDSVTTDKIKNMNVTAVKIAADAVTTDKIANGNVTTEKLADAAVTGAKLAAGSVSEEKLALDISNRLKALENEAFTHISYNAETGVLTFTATNGTVETVDLPLELIVSDKSYFDDTPGAEAAVLVLAGGGEIRIPIDSMTSRLVEYMNGIRERMFDLQEAPPISSLADALLLTTPTLAQLATLS